MQQSSNKKNASWTLFIIKLIVFFIIVTAGISWYQFSRLKDYKTQITRQWGFVVDIYQRRENIAVTYVQMIEKYVDESNFSLTEKDQWESVDQAEHQLSILAENPNFSERQFLDMWKGRDRREEYIDVQHALSWHLTNLSKKAREIGHLMHDPVFMETAGKLADEANQLSSAIKKLNELIEKYQETYELKPLYWGSSWSEFQGRYPYISIITLY